MLGTESARPRHRQGIMWSLKGGSTMREIWIQTNREERPTTRWPGLAVAVVFLFLISAAVVTAATLPDPAAGNDWRDLSGFIPNNNGVPYFDHSSWDGSPPGNIW